MSESTAGPAAPSRLARAFPGVVTLRGYQRAWLTGDLVAGLTVAAYLVPQVMAYAQVAKLPTIVGLWAAAPPLVVYAILGSSRRLSAGPESTTALMTAASVAALGIVGPDEYAAVAAMLALLVGVVCLVGWAARLGVVAGLLSKPVLIGYMAGIAVLMVVSQLGKITRVPIEGDTVFDELSYLVRHLDAVHVPTLALSTLTLVLLLGASRRWPMAPVPLVVMVLAAVVVAVFDLGSHGIDVVGQIPSGLPHPSLPDVTLDQLRAAIVPAMGVAIVAFSDNILESRAFQANEDPPIDSNQELLALGTSNIAVGLVQGFPVSSSGSRTAIASALGARSQLHSLVAAALVVLTVLFLGPALSTFPLAALGAIVVYAALRLLDLPGFRGLLAFRHSEALICSATALSVLLLGVLPGIGLAIALSILDLLRRVAHPHDGVLGYVPGVPGMHDIDDYPEAIQVPGLVVYRYDAPLCFANVADFKTRALASLSAGPGPTEWFLLNAEANTEIDMTAVEALSELRDALASRGVQFAMARVKQDMRDGLAKAGFLEQLPEERIYMTLPTAVAAYVAWYTAEHGGPPPGDFGPPT